MCVYKVSTSRFVDIAKKQFSFKGFDSPIRIEWNISSRKFANNSSSNNSNNVSVDTRRKLDQITFRPS